MLYFSVRKGTEFDMGLEAIQYSLESTKHIFQSKIIFWYTDNYYNVIVATKHICTI